MQSVRNTLWEVDFGDYRFHISSIDNPEIGFCVNGAFSSLVELGFVEYIENEISVVFADAVGSWDEPRLLGVVVWREFEDGYRILGIV